MNARVWEEVMYSKISILSQGLQRIPKMAITDFKGCSQHWLVSSSLNEKIEGHKKDLQNLEKEKERIASLKGLAEKKEAIEDMLSQLEIVESALLKKDAKTFEELYPNFEAMPQPQDDSNDNTAPADYGAVLGFKGIKDLTLDRKNAYVQL